MSAGRVLLATAHHPLRAELARRSHDVIHEEEFEPALLRLDADVHTVVSGVEFADERGLEFCQRARERAPDVPLVVLSSEPDLDLALAAMRVGANEFLLSSDDIDETVDIVERIMETHRQRRTLRPLELASTVRSNALIGGSPAIVSVMNMVDRVACSAVTVCITGESGTGKELVARAIHEASGRGGPFLPVNCAALPRNLLESELFGHARGAFTDATSSKTGLLLEASGGTVFFDEIGDMPLDVQAKLLRALQERVVRPVGSRQELPFDVRIVVATHRDLEQEVEKGTFRSDLFYRLCVVRLEIPPLRERVGDIELLAGHFLRRAAERLNQPIKQLTPAAREKILRHPFPGNVRELANAIERGVAVSPGEEIGLEDLPIGIQRSRPESVSPRRRPGYQLEQLNEVKTAYLRYVLDRVSGNRSHAARILGVDRRTIQRLIERGWV